jgi:hypothetical protein
MFSEKHVNQLVLDFKSLCALCDKFICKSLGQGGHIVSLSPKGPRSYKNYEQYNHLEDFHAKKIFDHNSNGLWLCYECHRKIDVIEPEKYPMELLYVLRQTKINQRKHSDPIEDINPANRSDPIEDINPANRSDPIKQSSLSCENCGKSFTRNSNLNYHIEHNVCIKPSKTCPKCGHQFSNKSMLEYHIEHKVCERKKNPKIKITMKKQMNIPLW